MITRVTAVSPGGELPPVVGFTAFYVPYAVEGFLAVVVEDEP